MRTIIKIVLGVVGLTIAIVVAVPYLVATEWMRDQVTAAVRDQTGREFIVAGDTSLSLFPDVALVVENATLMNPPGRDGAFARMAELDFGLKLMPLLSGRIEVNRFILTGPVINLEIDHEGVANWTTASAHSSAEAVVVESDPAGDVGPGPADPLSAIESLGFGDVQIVDGTVTYEDARSGDNVEISAINSTVRLASLDEPLEIDGTMAWQGEQVAFKLSLQEPRALATGTPTGTLIEFESAHIRATYQGTLAAKGGIDAEGDLDVSTPSLKELSRWLGIQPPHVDGLAATSISGVVKAGADGVSLSNAQLTMDGASAEGGFLISLSGDKPLIQATLAADRIDVNRYLRPAGAPGTSDASQAGDSAAAPSGPPAEWGAEPIDVDALRSIDADLRISTRELLFRDLTAEQSALAVTLKDGVLTVDLSELQLYDGRAVGKFIVNGSGETPAIAVSFSVDEISGLPMLRDAAGLEWLDGRGQLSGALASRGNTERQLIDALNGDIALRFTDGAIRGFNAAQMLRSLSGGASMAWSREDTQQTDFSEFSASFTVAKGIAQTDNISLLGPLVRLSGAGVTNLPARAVDFRIRPKVVGSLEGQGGQANLAGLEVPLMIRGPWDAPTITPDLEAVIRDPQSAIDAIQQIGRSLDDLRKGNGGDAADAVIGDLTKKEPKEFLDMLLGGGQPAAGEGQGGGNPEPSSPVPENVFNQLLGR